VEGLRADVARLTASLESANARIAGLEAADAKLQKIAAVLRG
jgi:hypothetical protein